jgi:zinc transport system substrate-binding protein
MIMKNKTMLYIAGGIALFVVAYIVFNLTSSNKSGISKAQVAASFYPLYFFSSEISKGRGEVFNITPAGVEPHDYDPTPQDIVKLQESSMVVVNGAGFEPWLDRLKEELKDKTVIYTSEGIELVQGVEEHEEEDHEEEEAPEPEEEGEHLDPHVWLSPRLAKFQVDKILQGYVQIDPGNKALYEKNAQGLKQKLDELDSKFRSGLSSCSQRDFVTSHAAFGYLAKEYGLNQVAISGISPDEEPSPAQLAEVTDFARENNVKYIFFETLLSPKLSETIAREVGAQTLVLDPVEGLSDDDIKQGKNYFTVMENNLQNLQTALECSK